MIRFVFLRTVLAAMCRMEWRGESEHREWRRRQGIRECKD